MAATNKVGIQATIAANIRSAMSDTSAEDVRLLMYEILDSYVNVKDGGYFYEVQTGYKTQVSLSDPKAFTYKKWVEDYFASAFTGTQDYVQRIDSGSLVDGSIIDNGIGGIGIGIAPFSTGIRMPGSVSLYFDTGDSQIRSSGDSLIVTGWNKLSFVTATDLAMYINDLQDVGIGTNVQGARLHVKADAGKALITESTIDGTGTIHDYINNDAAFTSGQEMRIDFKQQTTNLARYGMKYFGPDFGFNFYGMNDGGFLNSTPAFTIRGHYQVGFNIENPSATGHIRGTTSDSTEYAFKIYNAANNYMVQVRNDNSMALGHGNVDTDHGIIAYNQGAKLISFATRNSGNQTLLATFDAGYTNVNYRMAVGRYYRTPFAILDLKVGVDDSSDYLIYAYDVNDVPVMIVRADADTWFGRQYGDGSLHWSRGSSGSLLEGQGTNYAAMRLRSDNYLDFMFCDHSGTEKAAFSMGGGDILKYGAAKHYFFDVDRTSPSDRFYINTVSFTIDNASTTLFDIDSVGVMHALPTYGITTNSGTYGYMGIDSTGKIFKAPTPGGGGSVDITYSALAALKTANTLVKGTVYRITDRDLGIFVQALDTNKLDKRAKREMLIASHVVSGTQPPPSGTPGKVWSSFLLSLNPFFAGVGDKVVWGGKVWISLTGATGTATNDYTLDATNWVAASFVAGSDYSKKVFDILYDFDNDLVYQQTDEFNNQVGPFTQADVTALGYNPCNITDWDAFGYTYTCNNNKFRLGCINLYSQFDLDTFVTDNNISYIRSSIFSMATTPNCISKNTLNFSYYAFGECKISGNVGISQIFNNNFTTITDNVISDPTISSFTIRDNPNTLYGGCDSNSGLIEVSNNIGYTAVQGNTNVYYVQDSDYVEVINIVSLRYYRYNRGLCIQNNTYTTTTDIQRVILSAPLLSMASDATILNNLSIHTDGTIRQFLEYTGSFTTTSKFISAVVIANSRIVEAVITGASMTSANTLEFGVETDAVAYMSGVSGTTLAATPQRITTISSILTVGKRYYLKTASGTVGTGSSKVRVWLTMKNF